MGSIHHIKLARYLALAWLGLVIYASLYPLAGWRDTGVAPFVFLAGGWPRYWTVFDLVVNVGVYVPLGVLLALALEGVPGRFTAALLAALLTSGLSFGLETAQNWLPSRLPSNLDLACNSLGGLIGAVIAQRQGPGIFARVAAWERGMLAAVPHAEAGLTLLGLWLFAQLTPETVLFGSGDLRRLFGDLETIPYRADHLVVLEAAIVACNTLAVGLLLRQLVARQVFALPPLLLFFLGALAIRALATAVVVAPAEAFEWLTPGAARGLLAGGLVLVVASFFGDGLRLAIASVALLAGTVIVNIAPESPYRLAALAAWQQGHFLNFNGLTRVVSVAWPFLALPYLSLLSRRSAATD